MWRCPAGRFPSSEIKKRRFDEVENFRDQKKIKKPLCRRVHGVANAPIEVTERENDRDENKDPDYPSARGSLGYWSGRGK